MVRKEHNPSSLKYGEARVANHETLLKIKSRNRELRILGRVNRFKANSDKLSISQGTCWMCWMDLTNKPLNEFRMNPFSDNNLKHDLKCPICGYPSWKGRIWYPFRYLRGWVGNPSSRFGMHEVNQRK